MTFGNWYSLCSYWMLLLTPRSSLALSSSYSWIGGSRGSYYLSAFSALRHNHSPKTTTTTRLWNSGGGVVTANNNNSEKTRYTIDDDVCAPTEEKVLKKIVVNHCQHLDQYLQHRPIASHTRVAFDAMMQEMPALSTNTNIILDSGCGTGRSTRHLGTLYPDHFIIGVDRSLARLNRHGIHNHNRQSSSSSSEEEDTSDEEQYERPFQVLSDNIILVRAELTDFWRCCLDSELHISKHYILYPNPYPRKRRIKQRFYGHPSFPLILKLGGDIALRSNWEGYLKEFSSSVQHADAFYTNTTSESSFTNDPLVTPTTVDDNWARPYRESALLGPKERMDKTIAWTNFEKKYDTVGENTYELLLHRTKE